jgi:Tol biopolymer transport system component
MKKKILLLLFFASGLMQAQYFGGNKPRYDVFNFQVFETPHIELYTYLKREQLRKDFLYSAEKWFHRHHSLIKDTFDYKIPVILYNDHADFQQTTAISGEIGVGTGGVTEALKNRITMPVRPSYGQTDHVLGHEMVHAFQYNIVKSDDSLSYNNLMNVPLWMVEGMAEYLSLGRYDGHTAMWMRDAVVSKDFPLIKDLYKNKYFPYRYGQNFWAYIGGTYGDDKIKPLFYQTLKWGLKQAVDTVLHTKLDSLSKDWKRTNEVYYSRFLSGRDTLPAGKIIYSLKNAGKMNVSPVISPDGKKMIFLSEKNVLSMDLYIADLQSGKLKRIASKSMSNHIDAIDAFESAGTWSPDSKYFMFIIFKNGKNQLAKVDVEKAKIVETVDVKGLQAFSYPVWSPDGKSVLLLGQVQGQSDLYLYHLDTKSLEQLTDDKYAEMQPAWSRDGKQIVFSTDYYYLKRNLYPVKYHIGILHLNDKQKTYPNIFPGANNMNPQFDKTGENIYFLSDFDGFRDLFRYNIKQQQIYRLTRFFTGISGITIFSPAFSINDQTGEIVYNYFMNHQYQLAIAKPDEFNNLAVDDMQIDMAPSLLPPNIDLNYSLVERLLRNRYDDLSFSIEKKPYRPKFKLDYISNIGIGIGTSTAYGTGMAGGVSAIFSDMLGQHQLYTALSLNGEVYDFGGYAAYFNQKHRIGWGTSLSHIPYTNYYQGEITDVLTVGDEDYQVPNYKIYTVRMFEEKLGVFAAYPFSKRLRAEIGGSLAHYSYRITSSTLAYNGYYWDYVNDLYKVKEESPEGFNFHEINTAFVGDNSVFGLTAPLKGQRYRIGIRRYFGKQTLNTFTLDYRKYFYAKPVTFAFRFSHFNRFGEDAELTYYDKDGVLPPMYLGYDFYVRGYSYTALFESLLQDPNSLWYNDLMGSKMIVSSFEIRLPFTGPERLSLIKSGVFFTDLNLFVDSGIIWNSGNQLAWKRDDTDHNIKYPIFSTGLSLRINLFGQIIIQPYYAFPLSLKTGNKAYFGLNFYPGF